MVEQHPPREDPLNAPTVLEIHLLGTPAVTWQGNALPISRRQVRALLYRLAAEPEPIPREQLCFLFWPDVPEAAARRKLTGLLAHLRRTLPLAEMLVARDDHVGLDPDLCRSEMVLFQRQHGGQPSQAPLDALRQAVELYRGSFLAGFSMPDNPEYESWLTFQRQNSERIYLEALATLIEGSVATGDLGAAITYAQRYVETDELAEEVHRRLIELYGAAGSRSAATRQYEQVVAVMERELGVEPLPETRAAYQAVLDSDEAAAAPRKDWVPQTPAPGTVAVAPVWTTLPGLDLALVGRDAPLRRLEAAYLLAQAGAGAVVLISGEPGIGKSRLLQEFAEGVGDDALVLAGAGYQDAQASPYQPIVEALRPAIVSHYASLNVPDWCLAAASRLMPELRLLIPNILTPASTEGARQELFEALSELFFGLAAMGRPALLCLDDLHWADSTTLAWLSYVGRRLASMEHGYPEAGVTEQAAGVAVIGTYREEQGEALAEMRRALSRQGVLAELELGGLDEPAVMELLHPLADRLPDAEELAGYLQQVTGGNPFFLLETVRAVLEADCAPDDLVDPGEEAGFCLPESVIEAVRARIERLDPRTRQVLEAASVLGRSFDYGLVQRTSGRGEMETVDGLDQLMAHNLLQEGAGGFHFCHDVIQAVVSGQLSQWRRRVLHRRAGEALEDLDPGDAPTLAWHFEQAGEPGRAALYCLEAGREARAVFAHVEARAFYDRALTLLGEQSEDSSGAGTVLANPRLRLEAYDGRGWALRLVGDMQTFAQDLEEVSLLAHALGDPHTLAHLRWRQAYTQRWFCSFPLAQVAAEKGVQLSRKAEDRLLEAMCLREVGLAQRAMGDYDEAQRALEEALAIFVKLGETGLEVHTMGNLATLFWYVGQGDRSLDVARQALERCDEAGLLFERRLPLGDMGAAASAMGAVELAQDSLEESLEIARQTGDRTQEILCHVHLGWLSLRMKRYPEAQAHLATGLALAEKIGSPAEQGWLLCGLAEVKRLTGEGQAALALVRSAEAMARRSGAAYDLKLVRRVLGHLGAELLGEQDVAIVRRSDPPTPD